MATHPLAISARDKRISHYFNLTNSIKALQTVICGIASTQKPLQSNQCWPIELCDAKYIDPFEQMSSTVEAIQA
jgi:hypothetical protein